MKRDRLVRRLPRQPVRHMIFSFAMLSGSAGCSQALFSSCRKNSEPPGISHRISMIANMPVLLALHFRAKKPPLNSPELASGPESEKIVVLGAQETPSNR